LAQAILAQVASVRREGLRRSQGTQRALGMSNR